MNNSSSERGLEVRIEVNSDGKESRQNKLTTSIHGNPGEPGLSEIDDQVILAGLLR